MNETDTQVGTEGTDNQDTLTQGTSETLTQDQTATDALAKADASNPYQPFKTGKERFKVNGQEEEWDWETTRKHAQLGKTAYLKMQEAAELKKKSEQAYKQLLELAQKDPEGLIKALNPNYTGSLTQQASALRQNQDVTEQDPRDLELRKTQDEVSRLSSILEEQQIEAERKAINAELDQAQAKYPVLKGDKFAINYIKSEYRKALQTGIDVTIDDVAFHVSQELQEIRNQRTQQTQKRLEEKRKQAPVNVVSAASESASKPMSLEDVKKLAGRTY